MLFYTNVLEIPGYVVGLLFLISRVLDAFTDMGMGRLVDTMKPFKEGRFKGIIRRAAPFVCLSGFLLFLYVVKDWSYPAKLAYVSITYIIWGVSVTLRLIFLMAQWQALSVVVLKIVLLYLYSVRLVPILRY